MLEKSRRLLKMIQLRVKGSSRLITRNGFDGLKMLPVHCCYCTLTKLSDTEDVCVSMFTEDDVETEDSCRLPSCQCDIATDEVAYKGAADTDVMLSHDQCTPVNGSIRGKWIHRQVPGFITRT